MESVRSSAFDFLWSKMTSVAFDGGGPQEQLLTHSTIWHTSLWKKEHFLYTDPFFCTSTKILPENDTCEVHTDMLKTDLSSPLCHPTVCRTCLSLFTCSLWSLLPKRTPLVIAFILLNTITLLRESGHLDPMSTNRQELTRQPCFRFFRLFEEGYMDNSVLFLCIISSGGNFACFAANRCNKGRGQLKCDGTGTEARFRLSAKRTGPFKSAGGVSSVEYWQPRCAHQR